MQLIIVILIAFAVDSTVISFEHPTYKVLEDVGIENLALRLCINVMALSFERTVRLLTVPGTAQGRNHNKCKPYEIWVLMSPDLYHSITTQDT